MTVQDILNQLNPELGNTNNAYSERLKAIKTLKHIIENVGALTTLDEESIENRVKFATTRSGEYGKIGNLLNLLSSIYSWPVADKSEAKDIPEIQEEIIEYLLIAVTPKVADLQKDFKDATRDTILEVVEALKDDKRAELQLYLSDLKESKGYHAFIDETTMELTDGVEPVIDDLIEIYERLLKVFGIKQTALDFKLTDIKWQKAEDKALKKAEIELQARAEALEAHEALLNS